MNQIIMWIMAVGAVLGGVDRIAGNRFGLGKRFEEGFTLLGPTALSMSGIICLALKPRSRKPRQNIVRFRQSHWTERERRFA